MGQILSSLHGWKSWGLLTWQCGRTGLGTLVTLHEATQGQGQCCDTIPFSFSWSTAIQNKDFQAVMPRFSFVRGKCAASVGCWSVHACWIAWVCVSVCARARVCAPSRALWPPTYVLRAIPFWFLLNHQPSSFPPSPYIPRNDISFLWEINFCLCISVSSLIYVPESMALQILNTCFFKRIKKTSSGDFANNFL